MSKARVIITAVRAANREDAKVRDATWHDHSRGHITFADYVATDAGQEPTMPPYAAFGDLNQ